MVKKGEKTLDKIRKKLLKDSFRNYTFNTEINKDLLEHYEESLIEEAREKVFLNKFKKMKINKDDFEMVDSIYVKPDASSKSSSKSSTNSSKSPSKSSTKSSKSEVSRGSSKSSKASTKNSKLSSKGSKGSKGSKSSNMVNTGNKKYTYVDHEDYVSRPFLNNRGIPVRINTLLTMEKLRQKTETPKIPKRSTKPFPGTEQKGRGIVKKTRKPKKPVLKKNIYKAGSSAKVSLGGFVYRGVYAGGKVVNVDTVQADVDIMKIERGQVDIGSVVDFVDSFGDMKKGRISKILGNRLTIKFNKSQKYTFPKASIKIVGSIFI